MAEQLSALGGNLLLQWVNAGNLKPSSEVSISFEKCFTL